MHAYIPYLEIIGRLPISKGDILYVSSDILELSKACRRAGERFDCGRFIESARDAVGESGTLLFPTFNWDFCVGKTFDYHKTPCKTGALGTAALKTPGFVRTRHPIYSFAVWGRDAERLCLTENISSFGSDSPFAYLHKNGAKNLLIGVDMQHSFTFAHYAEETCHAPYRYLKEFSADYTDENGRKTPRAYSMYVRNLEIETTVCLAPLEAECLDSGVARKYRINGVGFMAVDLSRAFEVMKRDIEQNRGRKMACYKGQDD
jgi:aminoglycoside 3-N-acetyltransferase